MSKFNGFTLIEILIATGIFMIIVMVFVPIITQIKKEETVLSERRSIAYELHDELQPFIWTNKSVPDSFSKKNNNGKTIRYTFKEKNKFIKGCAHWENARKTNETFCLEGLAKK
ncbi:type II secretion system protein [Oceanobacillus sp. Castelsardo]|uniref:type II secretion system protein n=1 Tax=Oceanobacillus sp. Castelsardo TaxID=1851204 RepID=UPI000838997E|nr:type II secretion system protein [Oceanobacillus sp. Castelsardo]